MGTRADLVSALQDANVGTITLTADITLDANESLAINRSVTLDLGGHAITGADGPVLVAGTQGGTDAFKVVIKGNGTITGGNGGATMPGGLLVQGAGTQVVLESGAITGNRGTNGGGVWVRDNALFTMNGGSLSNNQADATMKYGKGGGVYVTGATFVMNDGSISNNTSTNAGGGVACGIGGVFTMNGGLYHKQQREPRRRIRVALRRRRWCGSLHDGRHGEACRWRGVEQLRVGQLCSRWRRAVR